MGCYWRKKSLTSYQSNNNEKFEKDNTHCYNFSNYDGKPFRARVKQHG